MKKLYGLLAVVLTIGLLVGCSGEQIPYNTYKYKVTCYSRHDMPFFCNGYEVSKGRTILYDARVFQWGTKVVEVYIYPNDVAVSIEPNPYYVPELE